MEEQCQKKYLKGGNEEMCRRLTTILLAFLVFMLVFSVSVFAGKGGNLDPERKVAGLKVISWSEPLRLDTLSLNTSCIPESYSLLVVSRIPPEADSLKMNAPSSYYTNLL